MECGRQISLSFWAIFCPFTPLTTQQVKILKIMKKAPGDNMILHRYQKSHMLYCSWDIACDRCNFHFSFWVIFCPCTPITAWKIKILKKMKKAPGDIIIWHMCTKNYDTMMHRSWDIVRDGWMDRRRMEKVTYWGGCPT